MKTKILKSELGSDFSDLDEKIMDVKLSSVIAEVEKNIKSKTDFIKKMDLSGLKQYVKGTGNLENLCTMIVITNEGQYFKLSEEDGILKTKDSWSSRNSTLVNLKKFA